MVKNLGGCMGVEAEDGGKYKVVGCKGKGR